MDSYHRNVSGNGGNGGVDEQICISDWQVGDHHDPNNETHDIFKLIWKRLNQDDDDDQLNFPRDQTPLKDCCDFGSDLFNLGDITCKATLEESPESKRRRMLEYPFEPNQLGIGNQKLNSSRVAAKVAEISLLCNDEPQSLNWVVQPNPNDLDAINSLSNGALCQAPDNYLENCSNGISMNFRPDQMPCSQGIITYCEVQTGVSETYDVASMTESSIMKKNCKPSTLKVSKGGNSLIELKKNITTSIACPFTIIKPSWHQGDVTLKDINQRIHAPPKKFPQILETSAFSGKLVIGKTRIRMEGGKGSITILRTKG